MVIALAKPTGQAISVISVLMVGMAGPVSRSAVLVVMMCVSRIPDHAYAKLTGQEISVISV